MIQSDQLCGVFAASLTPLQEDFSPALDEIAPFLSFLAYRGCHGALILGTTGEGPSFSPAERRALLEAALQVRQEHPGFKLLAGTGTPSLDETSSLTRDAFDLGYDGVVVLPPYYFRKATDDGLFIWYRQVILKAVPSYGAFFGYHIPGMTGVGLSPELLQRLKDAFPRQFVGIKDSSADPANARLLGERFGRDLVVFSGTDSLFSLALENRASGCITALANLCSPDLRRVWDAFQAGKPDDVAQSRLDAARSVMEHYPPNPPLYKALLARLFGRKCWPVRPPLLDLPAEKLESVLAETQAAVPGFGS